MREGGYGRYDAGTIVARVRSRSRWRMAPVIVTEYSQRAYSLSQCAVQVAADDVKSRVD